MNTRPAGGLRPHIGLGQGIALYLSAILGAGVLVLPGQVASMAGPASLLSWAFACALGVPLAWLFAALARRYPDAGGVATYVGKAFGPTAGGVAGWLYFVAGSVGQTIVPLTGGYYVARALQAGPWCAYAVAAAILASAVGANLLGVRVSSQVQVALAGGVAAALVLTIAAAAPRMSLDRLTPFAPHGIAPIGAGVIVLFFAFAGWEAVAHLVSEFNDPDRDVPRAVGATVAVVTLLYLGIAAAIVLTGTYGNAEVDHVAIGLLLERVFGGGASAAAAGVAVVISLGTTNAFIAGVSRLGYSLARDGWLPPVVSRVDGRSVPVGGVLTVATVASSGLALSAALSLGSETLVIVPATLVVAVYLLAAVAGARLLSGRARTCAVITIALVALVVPSAAKYAVVPAVVAALALFTRAALRRGGGDDDPLTRRRQGATTGNHHGA